MKVYRNLVIERIRYALAAARAAQPLEHSGVKGTIRELLMADLFRPLLPADLGIASGIVISAFDEGQSAQQDIVVFDKSIIPPILFEQGPAIIPVESALACVEVKSKLTAAELRAAITNAQSVKSLSLHSGKRDEDGNWIEGRTPGPSAMLLALDSDLTLGGESEADRYKTILSGEHGWFSCICVAGRACIFPTEQIIYDRPTGKFFKADHTQILGTYREVSADAEHAEMLAFIGAVIQLIQRIGSARGQPPLDAYFNVEENTDKRKIRLTSGDHSGKYVGVSEHYESRDMESRDTGYSFYHQPERGFSFLPGRASEIQAALKTMGISSEPIPVTE